VEGVGSAQRLQQRVDGRLGLDVDVEQRVRQLLEQLLKAGDRFAAADLGGADRAPGSAATAPEPSVVRSSTGSWCTTTTPSLVACTSVSR
jgi:hypothetical protein